MAVVLGATAAGAGCSKDDSLAFGLLDSGARSDLAGPLSLDSSASAVDLEARPDLTLVVMDMAGWCLVPVPPSLDFGMVSLGASRPLALEIQNSCGTGVQVRSIDLTGFGRSEFDISGPGFPVGYMLTLPPGGFVRFAVSFTPFVRGAQVVQVVVTPNGLPIFQVPLEGTGI